MSAIIILGGGGHARSCMELILASDGFEIAGFVLETNAVKKHPLADLYLGEDHELQNFVDVYQNVHVGVGQVKIYGLSKKLYTFAKRCGATMPVLVSNHAILSSSCQIGEGTSIFQKTWIDTNSQVGVNCIINANSTIMHDCKVEGHCHIGPSVTLCGGVTIGQGSFIGAAAVVLPNVTVGENVLIGAGEVVKSDVSSGTIVNSTRRIGE